MARFLKRTTKAAGLPPGTLVFVGEQRMDKPVIRLMKYDSSDLVERELTQISDLNAFAANQDVTWLNIDGVHEAEVIEEVGRKYSLSPLLLEDVMNTGQRPKVVEYGNHIFVTLKMLQYIEETGKIVSQQLSLVVGEGFLITFQEQKGDVFDPVRERIRLGRKRIRGSNSDFLAYSLLDVVCENYVLIIEILGEKIDDLEERLLENPRQELLFEINRYKQEINYLRKSIRPVREIVNIIQRTDNLLIKNKSREYWRELQEINIQAIEGVESYREVLLDQLNLYHTTMSTKMNDRMKVLTIFSAIFIPLTFIAGIYGTNFDVLPELHFEYSYFIMLGIMVFVASSMLLYFWKKKWL